MIVCFVSDFTLFFMIYPAFATMKASQIINTMFFGFILGGKADRVGFLS
jgi:hypothetical protein